LASQAGSHSNQISAAILVNGVVGDSIIAARYLRDLNEALPELIFDVFSANLDQSRWIFKSVNCIRDHLQDSVFNIASDNYEISFIFSDAVSFRKTKREIFELPEALGNMIKRMQSYPTINTENQKIRHFRESTLSLEMFFKHNQTRASASQFISGVNYGGPQFLLSVDDDIIERHGLTERPYITVHNGYSTAEVAVNKSSTKSYLRFSEVIEEFRKTRSDLVFVQIGSVTSVPIYNVDLNLIGKTSLPQAAALVKRSVCHLDNESGFVSIASCFGTRCCVVYGPTPADYFYYSGNVAIRPIECGGCWWSAEYSMTQCPRGMSDPACIHSQPPEIVARSLLELVTSIET
jgi:ADP-heptose:LPS heptosyltransferase